MSEPHTGQAHRLHLLTRHRETLVALLREHLPGIEVWAYGSRVNGQNHDSSDLDLVLRSSDLQEIPIGQMTGFREALRESNIPFLVEARDWARLPESFHPEIEREYVVLVEGSAGWREYEIKELIAINALEIGDGYRAKNTELAALGVPFARAGNIKDGFQFGDADCFPKANLDRVGNKISEPKDVIFTSKGTVGRFAFVREDTPRFVYSPQLSFWRSRNHKLIDPRFLFFWMFSHEFFVQFKGVAGQTDMAEYVSLQDQRNMRVTLPPLPEQRAIAHILGTLDDKIELNRRMNETLESMARALFKSWFVDFDPVQAKAALKRHAANQIRVEEIPPEQRKLRSLITPPLRGGSVRQGRQPQASRWEEVRRHSLFSRGSDWTAERAQRYLDGMEPEIAALFPDSFVESELGRIPAGWNIRPLAECIDVTRGLSYKGSKLAATGLPMHNLNSIYEGGGYKQAGIKYYAGDFKARHTAHPGDLLVANTEQGHDRLLIGYAAIVPSRSGATSLFSHHLYRLRTSADLTPDYLCHLLNTQRMHDRVAAYATGTTVNMLPLDALQLPRVVFPCGPLVTVFDRVAKAARERQEQIFEEVHTLIALRDTLLPKLISGKIRVPDAMEMENAAGLLEGVP